MKVCCNGRLISKGLEPMTHPNLNLLIKGRKSNDKIATQIGTDLHNREEAKPTSYELSLPRFPSWTDLNFQYGDTPTVLPRFASSFLGSLAIWWADTAATLLPMQALLCNATFRWTGRVTLFVIIFRSFWPEGRSVTLSQYTVISQNVKPRLRYPAYKLPLDKFSTRWGWWLRTWVVLTLI